MGDFSTVLENIYYITGGPVLAGIAWFGLKQIQIAKKDLDTRIRREAATIAAQQAQRYMQEIIPLINEVYDKFKGIGIKLEYDGPIKDFTKEHLKEINQYALVSKWIMQLDDDLGNELISLLNTLESFSVYFRTGVADEKIAFPSVGASFCFTVRNLYPAISFLRNRGEAKYWESIVHLYDVWSGRFDKELLKKQADAVLYQLSHIKDEEIPPIGL